MIDIRRRTFKRRWGSLRRIVSKGLLPNVLAQAGNPERPYAFRVRAAAIAISLDPTGIGEITKSRLVDLCEDAQLRELLVGKWVRSSREVINLIDSEDLVPFGRQILSNRERDAEDLSLALYRAVVLDRVTVALAAQRASLLAVADAAPRLARSHQASLLGRCIDLIAQPPDPYRRVDNEFAAREAATALLVADSSLDEKILTAIRTGDVNSQALLDIFAAAIRVRDTERPSSVAAVLETWKPEAEQALSFCQLADTGFSSVEPVIANSEIDQSGRLLGVGWFLRHLMPALVGLIVAGAIWLAREFLQVPDGPPLAPGVTLGALALLLATHVVSAQLSAERLPGSLARFSSQPPSVVAGYSAGFSMVAASLISQAAPHNYLWRQIAVANLLFFSGFLVATLITLVRRIDTTTAAVGFARDQGARFAASGRRMGAIQAASRDASKQLESLPWARYGGSEPLSERREPIRAGANGFSSIDLPKLMSLSERQPWRDRQLTLHVSGGLGTLVHRDSEMAAIIPSRDVSLSRTELRAVQDAFRVHSEAKVEECAESLTVLAGLSADLAAQGNPGGSNRVADALIDLLASHLRACHVVRGESADAKSDEIYPVNLALQSVLTSSVRRIGDARTGEERRALAALVKRVLEISVAGDGAVTMAVNALPDARKRELLQEELEVVWNAGSRAMSFGTGMQTTFVNGDLERRMGEKATQLTTPMEIAARLTTLNVWVDQLSANMRWAWFWEKSEAASDSRERVLSAIRIGSASLLAGCASVALQVSLALKDEPFSDWRTYVQQEGVAQWESFLSQQSGYLLGADPEFALVQFLDFAPRAVAAVTTP